MVCVCVCMRVYVRVRVCVPTHMHTQAPLLAAPTEEGLGPGGWEAPRKQGAAKLYLDGQGWYVSIWVWDVCADKHVTERL